MKPVILLNAPPNAGKDTIAAVLSERLGLPHLEFKQPMYAIGKLISGLDDATWDMLYSRDHKEIPSHYLWGLSPREFLIDISERMIKPVCGRDYFGIKAGQAAINGGVFSDSGFNTEADGLVDIVGANRVFCVRFTREGCSFEGDSRKFLDTDSIVHYLDTTNDGTVDEIVGEIMTWVFTTDNPELNFFR